MPDKQTNIVKFQKTANEAVKLTNKFIVQIKPRATRYDIRDAEVKGLKVRVNVSGKLVFIAVGKVRGTSKSRTCTIGDAKTVSVDDARVAASAFLGQLQQGIDANQVKAEKANKQRTLEQVLTNYLKTRDLATRTKADYLRDIPMYCPNWWNKEVSLITEDKVCDWYLENSHRKTQIDKVFRTLKAVLEYAVGIRAIDNNPCEAVIKRRIRYKIEPKTNRVDTTFELTKMLDAIVKLMSAEQIKDTQGDFILFLLQTGLRLNEARTIKWSDIDWQQYYILITETKNKRPHVIPMTPLIKDMLVRRQKAGNYHNEWVFPNRFGTGHLVDYRKTLDKIITKAGITTVRAHDLRRTFSTILDNLGINEADIKALMNHADNSVTRKHYLQERNLEAKRKNLWEIGKYLERSVSMEINGVENVACEGTLRVLIYGSDDDILPCERPEDKQEFDAVDSMR